MPAEAISLALAGSIYPPAIAAVIALGRGEQVRLRVVLLVVSAYLTAFATGSLLLVLFTRHQLTESQARTPAAWVYLVGGLAMLWVAVRVWRGRAHAAAKAPSGPSRVQRYLQSPRLVPLLGVMLYVVPSPLVIAAVKVIADTAATQAQRFAYLAETILIMLWLIEVPMLMLLVVPGRAVVVLERVNGWFARRGRPLGALAAAAVGLYLLVVGVTELAG